MSRVGKYLLYASGLATERPHRAGLVDFALATAWAIIAHREYGVDWFLFGFALLMCGVRLGMSTQNDRGQKEVENGTTSSNMNDLIRRL